MNPRQLIRFVRFTFFLTVLLGLPVASQAALNIVKQPASVSRSLGDRATLSVSVSGDSPFYFQWSLNGSPLAGATNRSLTFTNLTTATAGSYTVVVTNAVDTVTSEPAVLDVDTMFRLLTDSVVSRNAKWGVSWGDYDGDGFIDLFSGGEGRNQLFHNQRDGTFIKVGPTNAITRRGNSGNDIHAQWADYDNDGNLDLFLPQGAASAKNQLYRGLGEGAFQAVTTAPVGTDTTATFSAVWSDFNRDGRLDLFLANVGPVAPQTTTNIFYLADAAGGFLRWGPPGLADEEARHYGASGGDFNNDGWPDLFMPANPGRKNLLLENREGTDFEAFLVISAGGSGGSAAAADFDNDGNLDVFMAWNTDHCHLFRGNGEGNFEEVFDAPPSLEPGRAGGATWGDYDNDGWLDLFVPRYSAFANDSDRNDSLYHNNGDGTFTRLPMGSLGNDNIESISAAWGDYDNDGFLDLVVPAYDANPSRLYHNEGNTNAWLTLVLVGTKSNRSAIGAKVRLTAKLRGEDANQFREVGIGAGWFSQNDPRVHFGLAEANRAEMIVIEWPSGQRQELFNVSARQFLTVIEPGGPIRPELDLSGAAPLLRLPGGFPKNYYAVDYADSLAETVPWTLLTSRIFPSDGSLLTVVDQSVATDGQRYYRIRWLGPE